MTVTGSGRDVDIVNLVVTSTVDTQISFHYKQSFNEIIINERTTNGLQLRTSEGSPDYFTIPSGSALDITAMGNTDGTYSLYLRSASGTSTVEVLGIFAS